MRKVILVFFALTIAVGIHAQVRKIYVDASKGNDDNNGTTVKSSVRTLDKVASIIMDAGKRTSVYVYLRNGEYPILHPISLNRANVGRKMTFAAYQNEKPVISGGYRISGWRLFDKSKNIYAAVLPQAYDSRQLFVNGLRAIRARETDTPQRWIKYDKDGHLTTDLSVLTWRNPQNIECVYREIWTAPRCGIASIKQVNDTLVRISMKQPGWMNCQNKGVTSTHNPWYIENAYEFLDEAGEWYLDKTGAIDGTANTIYYIPRVWENMKTANIIMPLAQSIFDIQGTIDENITDITFDGIEFSYTTWLRPSTDRGNPDAQNNVLRQFKSKEGELAPDGAAIKMKYAHRISIDNCRFTHLGGVGISMSAGCSNNKITKSLFYDIAATGIQLGDYKEWEKTDSEDSFDPIDKRNILSNNLISGNHVEACGVEYRSSTGIAAVFPVSSVFTNNTVRNMPYSGFHIGWGWTTIKHSVNGGNIFKRNWVENVMLELADGGSFYTLGANDSIHPNMVTENYFTRTMWGQGAYLDNGSAYYQLTNNVYDRIGDINVKINSGSHDNIATGIYSNKVKNLIAKNCDRDRIDTTYVYSASIEKKVDMLRRNAGTKMAYKTAWECLPDVHIYEMENADVTGNAYSTSGIGTKVYGYSGMGFISGFERGGSSSVSSRFLVSSGGSYTVSMKYSADKSWTDKLLMRVNGKEYPLTLAATKRGGWEMVSTAVDLKEGVNDVTIFNASDSKDFLYLDVIQVYKNE